MDRKLIELLICPVSQGKLKLDVENKVLISTVAGLVYPINDGIPVLLESAAMKLEVWESIKPDEARDHFARIAKENAEKSNAEVKQKEKKGKEDQKPLVQAFAPKAVAKKSAVKKASKKVAAKTTTKPAAKKVAKKAAAKTVKKVVKKTATKTAAKK